MQLACVILSSVSCPTLRYFSTLSYEGRDLKKKVIERKMCVLIFCTIFSETYLILRGTERDMIKKCVLVSMLRIRYSCHILKNLEVC